MLSAPVTVTPPAGELIPLAEAKAFLRVDGNELDAEIGLMAAAAVEDIEELTGVRCLHQRVRVGAGSFADLAHLRVGPIRAIVSISYRDHTGLDQLLAADLYELFGAPLEQAVRTTGQPWPAAAPSSIEIVLEVGYGPAAADVPAKLRYAAFASLRGKFEDVAVDIEPLITNFRFWL